MRAVALVMAVSLLGCFPHNPRARTISKWSEGAAIVAGIAMEAIVSNGADCDAMAMPGIPTRNSSCHNRAAILGGVGIALIFGGLLGFVATISTEPDEKPVPKVDIKVDPKPEAKPVIDPGFVKPATPTTPATPPTPTTPPAPAVEPTTN